MNKLVLDKGLTFRVDKQCNITMRNMQKLIKLRYRQAMYAFREMFSQATLEGCVCASKCVTKEDKALAKEMSYLI